MQKTIRICATAWMKAPRSFTVTDGKGETDLRNLGSGEILRRIIIVKRMEKGKTYYLRFKSALNQSDAQFFSDYFEYVPRSVFNGTEPEDASAILTQNVHCQFQSEHNSCCRCPP